MSCTYCNTKLPEKGYFCPNCSKQTKCKHCNELLVANAKVCVYCGEDIVQKNSSTNLNTIEFSETETGRSFKAAFSDTVGQSISDSFSIILANKINTRKSIAPTAQTLNNNLLSPEIAYEEAEILNDAAVKVKLEQVTKDIPTLKEIKLRDLAKTESDWFLVYAYYASDGGTKEFTRENIVKLYKDTERRTDNRIKSLSQYIKNSSKSQLIKSINDTDFILLEKGKNKAFEIFEGNSNSKTSKKTTSKNKPTNSTQKSESKNIESNIKKGKATNTISFIDLKLTHAEQKSLKDFFESKKPKSQNEKVLVVMKWFTDEKQLSEVSMEEINYLLSLVSKTPSALPQVLGNMVGQRFRWVTKKAKGKYELSSIGESHVLNKLSK